MMLIKNVDFIIKIIDICTFFISKKLIVLIFLILMYNIIVMYVEYY